jgi:hypothetical protein
MNHPRKDKTVCPTSEVPLGVERTTERIRFGDWLVRRGLINRYQLFEALNLAFVERCRIGDALVQRATLGRDLVEREANAHADFLTFHTSCPVHTS